MTTDQHYKLITRRSNLSSGEQFYLQKFGTSNRLITFRWKVSKCMTYESQKSKLLSVRLWPQKPNGTGNILCKPRQVRNLPPVLGIIRLAISIQSMTEFWCIFYLKWTNLSEFCLYLHLMNSSCLDLYLYLLECARNMCFFNGNKSMSFQHKTCCVFQKFTKPRKINLVH